MFQKLKFLFHFLKFSKDPMNTMEVFHFSDALIAGSTPSERAKFGAVFLDDKDSREIYESGVEEYLYKPFNLDELDHCQPGTLGHAYAKMMRDAGLSPEFFAYNEVQDSASYFTLRLRKTHDIYHVLTGFGTDVPGEIGLQAFYLGQFELPVPLSIMTSALLHIIGTKDMVKIRRSLEQIAFGYTAGRNAKKLQGVVWEKLWDTDLDALRQSLGVAKFAEAARLAA